MAIGYFASVAPRGYIAATPLRQRGAETIVWASWLTTDQLLALNSTEPGYSCREVSAKEFPLEILSIAEDGSEVVAESPESFYVYDADQGYILDADTREPKILTTQSGIFAYFRELSKRSEYSSFSEFFAREDREVQEGFTSPEAIAHFEQLLIEHELRALPNLASDGAVVHARDGYTTYAKIPSLAPPEWEGSGRTPWLRVTSTRDELDRSRETKVVAHPSLRQEIGTHASVLTTYPSFRNNGELETRPGVIASVEYRDDLPEGTLEADQTVRESLGMGLGEYVQLAPALSQSRRRASTRTRLLTSVQRRTSHRFCSIKACATGRTSPLRNSESCACEQAENRHSPMSFASLSSCSSSPSSVCCRCSPTHISRASSPSSYSSAPLPLRSCACAAISERNPDTPVKPERTHSPLLPLWNDFH